MNVNIALLTVTDTRTLKTDKSGNILLKKIKKAKHNLIDRKICKDSKKDIKKILKTWLKKKKIDVNIALLTVTDTRTLKTDKSGNLLLKKIKKAKHILIERKICKDSKRDIKKILKTWLKKKKIDVIITTGGTGLTGRDITPEALEEIADKKIPGFGEVFRYVSLKTVGTSSIQSRACAVLAKGKYIFALPGSSGGVTDAWDKILVHQLNIKHKPCNFVELFPRLKEK